jgi:uncharacterized damage-inducible protein DinB
MLGDVDMKATLVGYLQAERDTVLWKTQDLAERDLRRPMTASGTNLLGLVKHLAGIEAEYFGVCLGRTVEPMPWWDDDGEPNADMWATGDESVEQIVGLYRRAIADANVAIDELGLDAVAHVPWWEPQETTLFRLLVHMIAETARHAGHMDILRETIDGRRGLLEAVPNLPDVDEQWWQAHVHRLKQIAEATGDDRKAAT